MGTLTKRPVVTPRDPGLSWNVAVKIDDEANEKIGVVWRNGDQFGARRIGHRPLTTTAPSRRAAVDVLLADRDRRMPSRAPQWWGRGPRP